MSGLPPRGRRVRGHFPKHIRDFLEAVLADVREADPPMTFLRAVSRAFPAGTHNPEIWLAQEPWGDGQMRGFRRVVRLAGGRVSMASIVWWALRINSSDEAQVARTKRQMMRAVMYGWRAVPEIPAITAA